MAKLVLSMDGLVLREIALTKERTTLGRKPHNDIQIDNLAVSGDHAAIVTILNDSFLEDLNSTNGTLVNGKPIKKHFLQNNDVIELGRYKLKYVNDASSLDEVPEEFERTVVLRAEDVPAAARIGQANAAEVVDTTQPIAVIAGEPSDPRASANVPQGASIHVLSGPHAGRQLALTKAVTTIGAAGAQVAVISRRPQGYLLTHVEGDALLVNGSAMGDQPHPLQDQDRIALAGAELEFRLGN